jgi:hypothetical protein
VYLAGLRLPNEDVRELITLVDEPTRSFLEKTLALENEVVALTVEDRERILSALDDVRTDALAELRGVLLQEHEWRMREGWPRALDMGEGRAGFGFRGDHSTASPPSTSGPTQSACEA